MSATVPCATYRLQLGRGFGFREAAALVPYLARLGISHFYCSPFLRARAGSTHGYDIIDHAALNPEIGDERDLAALVDALRAHGMAQILDFVPNHMGVAQADNRWWLDLLEHGPASPFAAYFDVDWRPAKAGLRGKVLAPFLGRHYGAALEAGELRLAFDAEAGALWVAYHHHRFPLAPRSAARVLASGREALAAALGAEHSTLAALDRVISDLEAAGAPAGSQRRRAASRARAERAKRDLAALVAAEPALGSWIEDTLTSWHGEPGQPASWRRLHRLLEAQHYRLAYWRTAADEINYRRFFDVNELAALRTERPEVFDAIHARVLGWLADGTLAGLRIDHVDGLYDPRAYCQRLRAAAGRPFLLYVEKILAHHEHLREDWPVDGTTGYEFLALAGGLFVDPEGEAPLDELWRSVAPDAPSFDEEIHACRKLVLELLLAGELEVLARALDGLSESHWSTRDFTVNTLREALKEVMASFPVYRSYVDARGAAPEDRRDIDWAMAHARRRARDPEPSLFDWLHGVLTVDLARAGERRFPRGALVRLAMRFQQTTGPVTAKAVEDTAFYRHHRLVSLNEVGGDPRRFGTTPAAFHHANAERLRRWPASLLATSTHDTKRGEDVRLRIAALSELADEWRERVRRWTTWNRHARTPVDDAPAPAPDDEYFLYQILVGSWPSPDFAPPGKDADWVANWRARLETYLVKALREAKRRTSWRNANPAYEEAALAFLRALLDTSRPNPFLDDLAGFVARVAPLAAVHALAQLTLKCVAPGVPDVYQGCELWDLSLADPDNRRPVDFAARAAALAALEAERERDAAAALAARLDAWPSGEIKLALLARLLGWRRRHPEPFASGDYLPLAAEGRHADRVVAFARIGRSARVVVVAPRLIAPLLPPGGGLRIPPDAWGDTRLRLPEPLAGGFRDLLRDAPLAADARVPIPVARLLAPLPVAVLVACDAGA
ncbi:MAG TPA: malto-oligosyltrehalose synthase [Myxococcota bacterium]